MQKKKIVLIDDEEEFIRYAKSFIERKGRYEVAVAKNGKEGLELITAQKPDVILCDVLMPVMDGFELFKTVKKDPGLSKIPFFVLTARESMRDTFEALSADYFISKPIDPHQLVAKLDALLFHSSVLAAMVIPQHEIQTRVYIDSGFTLPDAKTGVFVQLYGVTIEDDGSENVVWRQLLWEMVDSPDTPVLYEYCISDAFVYLYFPSERKYVKLNRTTGKDLIWLESAEDEVEQLRELYQWCALKAVVRPQLDHM